MKTKKKAKKKSKKPAPVVALAKIEEPAIVLPVNEPIKVPSSGENGDDWYAWVCGFCDANGFNSLSSGFEGACLQCGAPAEIYYIPLWVLSIVIDWKEWMDDQNDKERMLNRQLDT